MSRIIKDAKDHFCSTRKEWEDLVLGENQKILYGIDASVRKLWNIIDESEDGKQILLAISLVMQCNNQRSEILTGKPNLWHWSRVRDRKWEAQEPIMLPGNI